jgi:hypothetical protein
MKLTVDGKVKEAVLVDGKIVEKEPIVAEQLQPHHGGQIGRVNQ